MKTFTELKLFTESEQPKMTPAQVAKKEEIVKSLKKKKEEFVERYGARWKEVMYATATKLAMEEVLTEAEEWVLGFQFDVDKSSKEGDAILGDLRKRFKRVYSGSGSDGDGFDVSFNGPKREVEKAKTYVEKKYKKQIIPKFTNFFIDESVELIEKSVRHFSVPPSPEVKKHILQTKKSEFAWSADSVLGGNSKFVVIPIKRGIQRGEDNVLMAIISNPDRGSRKIFSYMGTHINVAKAQKFARNNNLVTESVELDEGGKRWQDIHLTAKQNKKYPDRTKQGFEGPYTSTQVKGRMFYYDTKADRFYNADSPEFKKRLKESVELDEGFKPSTYYSIVYKGKVTEKGNKKQMLKKVKQMRKDNPKLGREDLFIGITSKPIGAKWPSKKGGGGGYREESVELDEAKIISANEVVYQCKDKKEYEQFMSEAQQAMHKGLTGTRGVTGEYKKYTVRIHFKDERSRKKFERDVNRNPYLDGIKESVELDEGLPSYSMPTFKEIQSKGKKLGDWMGKSYFEYDGHVWMLKSGRVSNQGPVEQAKKKFNKSLLKSLNFESVELDEVGRGLNISGQSSKISKGREDYLKSPEGRASLRRRKEQDVRGTPFGEIYTIASSHTAEKIHGELVDVQTANLLIQVADSLNDNNRKRFIATINKNRAGLLKMADFAWKQVK